MPDTLSIGLIFEHKDFLSMEWLNTQYKNQYTNLNHEDCLALLNKYLTFSHLQLCDFERLFWLCKTIEDSLGQEHPSLIDIIFSISRQGLEYINLNARKQLVLNGGNRIKINTKLFNQYCQWILEKLHPRNDVYHVYILVISIYNFIAIAPDDKQILEDIIDRLLEKNNLTPPLIKSVASTLLTHQKILCDPFHKLINIYLRDKDSAISNWLIHEIIDEFKYRMPIKQTWYTEDLVEFYDALQKKEPPTHDSVLVAQWLRALSRAQDNHEIIPKIENILENIHATTTLDSDLFRLLLQAFLRHLDLKTQEDIIKLYDRLCENQDKTMQCFIANTMTEQLYLNQITCEHPVLGEYQTAYQEQQQLLTEFKQQQLKNFNPVVNYSLRLLTALNDGIFYHQLSMPDHLRYTQFVITKLNELQQLEIIPTSLSKTTENQLAHLEILLNKPWIDLNALETFFNTIKDELDQSILNQQIQKAQYEREQQRQRDRNEQKTYIMQLELLFNSNSRLNCIAA